MLPEFQLEIFSTRNVGQNTAVAKTHTKVVKPSEQFDKNMFPKILNKIKID